MTIRRVNAEERLTTSFPLQAYAFETSPRSAARAEEFRDYLPYNEGNRTLVVEENGVTLAAASAIPMRQNVRGEVLPMAGVAGVATHPLARRQGHVRGLLHQLLDEMRDEGHQLSALYPFRPSFYARFGYVGLPAPRTVTFSPADLDGLLRADLPGEVRWERIGGGYQDWRTFTERCLGERHGFAIFPGYRDVGLRDRDEHWLLTARSGGTVTGAVIYRIDDHGGTLAAGDLLAGDPVARTLLLQFFARHVDQVERVTLQLPADELPELWLTDLAVHVEARVARPNAAAPMARLLSVDALAGLPVGPGRVRVELTGDRWLAGSCLLDGTTGTLELVTGAAATAGSPPTATLTAAGISALAYGVLDPVEVGLRGLGTMSTDAATELRRLFPRQLPYLFADF
ncbi:GNAT family N-acetyltransferase [Micromonospora peucetia]|uniref:GNAT family N-acetyltransferase n=1 Tax=Micromonospora peucetia TaxID=47871 RepID=A0A1C6URT0_9ACTN|nr:GNAT family N-acetyltransferase [Micromonospora peucetia]MCX4387277.1 GNAT family N-acetyltransferase [Micromonospora peucetia]WSA34700.1 GNAT family N-acetyltransferase [Micromonospora peucetia]SCL56686.1 Predicted acetyltransferase [Micromonospora peucetia]